MIFQRFVIVGSSATKLQVASQSVGTRTSSSSVPQDSQTVLQFSVTTHKIHKMASSSVSQDSQTVHQFSFTRFTNCPQVQFHNIHKLFVHTGSLRFRGAKSFSYLQDYNSYG